MAPTAILLVWLGLMVAAAAIACSLLVRGFPEVFLAGGPVHGIPRARWLRVVLAAAVVLGGLLAVLGAAAWLASLGKGCE